MNLKHYNDLLVAKEQELLGRRRRSGTAEQESGDGGARDIGDDSVTDEQKGLAFAEDEADANVLDDVRLALGRITDGSYGRCLEDDQPMDEKRLEAIPWAKYCAKHQAGLETVAGLRTPTL